MYELLILILATWRISMFLVYDDLTKNLRDAANVGMTKDNGQPVNLVAWFLGCFWCCSLLIAGALNPLAPCAGIADIILRPFAVSGGAILVHYLCRIQLQVGD